MARKPNARNGLAALVGGIFAVGLLAAPPALAQLSTSTIRGHVTAAGAAMTGAQVTARNVSTGYSTKASIRDDGAYVLTGLPPGTYRIEVSGKGFDQKTEEVTVAVGQTAELDIGVGQTAARLETITVSGNRLIETKTSEIATQVTPQQMQRLPQVTRNFLQFADLAPGVAFITQADGSTKLQGGAQSSASVNVYIDGVSQKNYVLQGGITGQDSSRGNPFPQSAIAEYKVITQNYKAEFDQVSSAAITAVTRSGTNQVTVDGFWDHTSQNWRAATPAELSANHKTESKQDQYGITLGGPIIPDRMHYFISYEGKDNKDPKTITLGGGATISTAPGAIGQQIFPTNAPFKEDLVFGKLDWSVAPDHYLEATIKYRKEKELTNVGGQNTVSYGTDKKNDETRFDLKHQWTTDRWMNEAHLGYEDAYWSPRASTTGNGSIIENGGGATIINIGGGRDFQDKGQKGWSLQDDLTMSSFNWNGSHVVKVGAKAKWVTIDAREQQPFNPQYHYDANFSFDQPYRVEWGVPLANVGNGTASSKNTQFGIYAQDDWEVNRHLTLNLGVRWDYEDTPSYNNYVTPPDVVAALKGWPNINSSNSGFNVNDFISTGSNRESYKGEFQPRVGFSYDVNSDQRAVVFGGYGRAYDRNLFDYLQLERTKGTFPTVNFNFSGDPNHPCSGPTCVPWDPRYLTAAGLASLAATGNGSGREIDLVSNDIKVPYSDQFSLGLRGVVAGWQTSISYSYIESKNGFAWLLGNRLANGSFFAAPSTWGAPFGSPIPGFGALLLGVSGLTTKTNAVYVTAEKPYSRSSGWGVTGAYTYSDSKENRQFGEHYALDYPDLAGYGWKPSSGVPKHRFVGTAIYDLPWGLESSAKLTLSSGQPKYGTNCLAGFDHCVFDQIITNVYRQLDLSLQKEFPIGGRARLRIRADVLNVFNYYNWDGYDTWWGAPGDPNLNLGHPDGSLIGPTRTFKLSVGVTF
ncbi:MAG: TonB-dependent receptor domain-containing protein [Usitatibacter sp.]